MITETGVYIDEDLLLEIKLKKIENEINKMYGKASNNAIEYFNENILGLIGCERVDGN